MKCKICQKEFELFELDEHHIHSKGYSENVKFNINSKYNKVFLCQNCHRRVHYGYIIIEGTHLTDNGYTLIYRNKDEPSITGLPDPIVWRYDQKKENK